MRKDERKILGAILLPIYVLVIIMAMVLWFLIVVTHLDKRFPGHCIRRLCDFSEKFYNIFYGDTDGRNTQ